MVNVRRKSPMVGYERLSPNCNKPRTGRIRRLTPHCVAGNLTIEATLGLSRFTTPDTTNGVSVNYAIGSDGRVGLGVEEINRSWCTSSRDNDHEAITFEISNNGGAPDWRMSDAAINAWLTLATEIAIFYGFKKINYQDKPANIAASQVETWIKTWAKPDEMIITLHRWYKNKECPGAYFIKQLPWLVKELNNRLNGAAPVVFKEGGSIQQVIDPPSATPTDKIIWNFLKGKGLNDFAVAGIMGNLYAESALRPNNLQNSYEKTLTMSDEVYTKNIDSGIYTNFVNDKAGYGLAQWTHSSRKHNLFNFAKSSKTSIGDLTMQLNFLWSELNASYKNMMVNLGKVTSVYDASTLVLVDYERPADQSDAVKKKRAEYAQGYFSKYKSATIGTPTTPGFKEYPVTITATSLNVRKGPGTNNEVVQTLINDNKTHIVVEEADGTGAKKWGRLKSNIGWISLDYTKKQ